MARGAADRASRSNRYRLIQPGLDSRLMTQFHDHLRVTFTQGLQREQILPIALPVVNETSGFDAVHLDC